MHETVFLAALFAILAFSGFQPSEARMVAKICRVDTILQPFGC